MNKIPLTQNKFALVDDEDYERLMAKGSWFFNGHYAARNLTAPGFSRVLLMHRVVMGALAGQEVDHINGDKLDNRKENLRFCTRAENLSNRGAQKNNKTGLKGVSRVKGCNRYKAQIMCEGTIHHLGSFDSPLEAAEAYNKAAVTLHGDFAKVNDLSDYYVKM